MAALPREAVVAVIGAGAMGAGIAQVAAQAGHRVMLFDTQAGAAAGAQQGLARVLAALAAKGRIGAADADAAAARVEPIGSLDAVAGATLVIEAIVEDLAVKRALLGRLESLVDARAILASNTSSLSITALAAGLRAPGRVVGMHFFNPAPVLPLVEVVSGMATDAAVAATVHATAAAWGKTPVHTTSTPGFIVNRCARPFYAEALRLLGERAADVATLDALLRDAGGFRMGPFELMDLLGHDVNFAVTRNVFDAYFGDPRFAPSVIQRELVDAGYLGRKTGRGFYDYALGATPSIPAIEPYAAPPDVITVHGDLGVAAALVPRWRAAGVRVEEQDAVAAFPDGAIVAGGAWLALSDGRTATARATAIGARRLVLFDLALDYGACTRLAIAAADGCDTEACGAAIGALQAAGIALFRLDDVAGLAVLRTVVMLANEAALAVTEGVATPADLDLAMRKGLNYPMGPLAWADAIGVTRVRHVLANLAAHYGEDRYRVAPLIARRAAGGRALAGEAT